MWTRPVDRWPVAEAHRPNPVSETMTRESDINPYTLEFMDRAAALSSRDRRKDPRSLEETLKDISKAGLERALEGSERHRSRDVLDERHDAARGITEIVRNE